MYFSTAAILALVASALALPTGDMASAFEKRALVKQTYAQFQVSDGVAGNALAEVNKKFPVDVATATAADLTIIKDARVVAENAETQAFNDAISKATGADKVALQNGKIKNKVLKLQLEVEGLQIDQRLNGKDNSAAITKETTKLNKNISLDKAAAGQASKSVAFAG